MPALLEVQGVVVRFGGLRALDALALAAVEREVVGVMGPNGAGKTTLFNAIAGSVRPAAGRIVFDGADVTGLRPWARCRRGIARTYQTLRPFVDMTAMENVEVGAAFGDASRGATRASRDGARAALALVGLTPRAGVPAGELTLFERKLLEIARALATRPRLLLLDEPLAGLPPAESQTLAGLIRRLRDELGITVLWIEHIARALRRGCDRVVVLHRGRLLAEGTPDEALAHPEVVRAYLGRRAETPA